MMNQDSGSVIYGINPIIEALEGKKRAFREILIATGRGGDEVGRIVDLATRAAAKINRVPRQRLDELVRKGNHQGVVAIVSPKEWSTIEDIQAVAASRNEPLFVVMLDEVEDPHNMGAVIRTAEAAGVHGVVVPSHRSAFLGEGVVKASAGAVEHMAVVKVPNLVNAIEEFKKMGLWVAGADASGEKSYTGIDMKGPLLLVIGSEGKGLRPLVRKHCDFVVRIPMFGKVSSLNASVSAAILIYEAVRQRGRSL